MTRTRSTLSLATLVVAVLAAGPVAQTPGRPTAVVLRFDPQPAGALSQDDCETSALELARQLLESGAFRMLDVLPLRETHDLQSREDLRRIAAEAGVEYLITGALHRRREYRTAPPRTPLVQSRPPIGVRLPNPRRPPLFPVRRPAPRRTVERVITTLDARLLDVRTGEIVHASLATHTQDNSAGARAARVAGAVGRAALTVISAGTIVRERRPLDDGLRAVVQETARRVSALR